VWGLSGTHSLTWSEAQALHGPGDPSLLSPRSLPERQPAGPFEKRSFVNPFQVYGLSRRRRRRRRRRKVYSKLTQ